MGYSITRTLTILCLLGISALCRGNPPSNHQNESYILAPQLGGAGTEPIYANISIAIASTILRPGPSLQDWLDYHLRWVQHVVIYMDDPSERPTFDQLCAGRPVTLFDGSQVEAAMTPESRILERQTANTDHAIDYLMERGYHWLLHIDSDELLYGPLVESRDWAGDDSLGLVAFPNHEALPVDFEATDPFRDCEYFWVNGVDHNSNFLAYGNGKSAVRLGPGVQPSGPHSFLGFTGRTWKPSGDELMILHYPYPSYGRWLAKFKYYGRFSDHWFGDRRAPRILDFMLKSRDIIHKAHQAGDWAIAKDFFNQRVFDKNARQRAVSEGTVRRYRPFATEKPVASET